MKAIILAAGRGSRMKDSTSNLPKCRTKLFGHELIDWQLKALKKTYIDKIGIVTGYLENKIKIPADRFHNPNWKKTNMVYSLLFAKKWLETDTCIISYSDIVYPSIIIDKIAKYKGDILITYDPNWKKIWNLRFSNPLDDAETFIFEDNVLIDIGQKTKTFDDIQGQYMGLLKTSPNGWKTINKILNFIPKEKIYKMDFTYLLRHLIKRGVIVNCYPIKENWFEVDTNFDKIIYEENFSMKFD